MKNAEGKTPIDVAAANGFHQTAALMRAKGRPRHNSVQLDSLLPPSSTHLYSGASSAGGPRHSGQLPAGGPPSGARPSPRNSPGPATPVGRVSPSFGVGPSPLQRQGYPPTYPPLGWQGAQAPAASSPPLNAWASTPNLPVTPQAEQPMAVSASGPAAVATPQAPQARDRSPAGRLPGGGTPVAASRGLGFPGTSASLPPPASQPAEILSSPSPSAPPGTMSMVGDALGAPGWWMHQGGAGNGTAPTGGQAQQAQQRSRAPSPAPPERSPCLPTEELTLQAQQQAAVAAVPSLPLTTQLVTQDGAGGMPSLPLPGQEGPAEIHSASSSDGLQT